jgi:hypothetical protein
MAPQLSRRRVLAAALALVVAFLAYYTSSEQPVLGADIVAAQGTLLGSGYGQIEPH